MLPPYIPLKTKKYKTQNIYYTVPSKFKKPRILIIGCGDIGNRIISQAPKFWRFIKINSKDTKNTYNYNYNSSIEQECTRAKPSNHIINYIYNLDNKIINTPEKYNLFKRILHLSKYIIYLAPPQNYAQQDFRIHNMRYLLNIQQIIKILYVSTTGVYGNRNGGIVYEHTPVDPQTDRAQRRVYAENYLRKICKKNIYKKKLSIFRVPGIYAQDRLPLDRIKKNIPILNTDEDVYTNHIHALDLSRILILGLFKKTALAGRIFNACDNSKIKAGDWIEYVAKAHDLPIPPRLKMQDLIKQIDENRKSFLVESRIVNNQRLLKEFNLNLAFPTIFDGI